MYAKRKFVTSLASLPSLFMMIGLAAGTANAATLTFWDTFDGGSFDVGDYNVVILEGSPTHSLTNVSDELRVAMPASQSGNALGVFNQSFVIDPSSFSGLESIDVKFDAGILNGSASVAALLEQGGVYVRGGTTTSSSDDVFVTYSFTASDGLDFTSNGTPIAIGLRAAASLATFVVNYRFDNLQATATSIPEPSCLVLLLSLAGCVLVRREPIKARFA
jgi:hypothetical protein